MRQNHKSRMRSVGVTSIFILLVVSQDFSTFVNSIELKALNREVMGNQSTTVVGRYSASDVDIDTPLDVERWKDPNFDFSTGYKKLGRTVIMTLTIIILIFASGCHTCALHSSNRNST